MNLYIYIYIYICVCVCVCRSQQPRGLRHKRLRSLACWDRWFRIPPGAWMLVCCECCVLSGRGLCDGPITRPEKSYRLWCVVVCDLETSKNEEAMARVGPQRHREKKIYVYVYILLIFRGVTFIYTLGLMTLCSWVMVIFLWFLCIGTRHFTM